MGELKVNEDETNRRIDRLKRGDWSFGHSGRHYGIGCIECPLRLHHHHDEFCIMPNRSELITAGIDPDVFRPKSRI